MDLEKMFDNFMAKITKDKEKKKNSATSISANSNLKADVKCQLCYDRGIIFDRESNSATPCKCQDERRRERLFKNSKITPAFRAKTFANFKTNGRPVAVKKMLQTSHHYVNNFSNLGDNNWLVLLGEPGCGKTYLSMAVANQLLTQGVQVLYFPHIEGIAELKNTFRDSEESLEDRLREMRTVPVLVWDDLWKGREDPTPWVLEIVFDIINHRYLNLLPTIISSELTPPRLLSVDKAIGSRILERGRGHLVVAEGQECNYRLV